MTPVQYRVRVRGNAAALVLVAIAAALVPGAQGAAHASRTSPTPSVGVPLLPLPPPHDLRLNYVSPTGGSGATQLLVVPAGAKPVFSWALPTLSDAQSRGVNHTAYRLTIKQMAPNTTSLPFSYDSGHVAAGVPLVRYGGPSLPAGTTLGWSVSWWSSDGRSSALSDVSLFDVEPAASADGWATAAWVGTADERVVRTELVLPAGGTTGVSVARARVRVASIGCATIQINGKAVGPQHGVCPWTNPVKRVKYQVFDATAAVQQHIRAVEAARGAASTSTSVALAVLLGRGIPGHFYHSAPAAKVQLKIDLSDGSSHAATTGLSSAWFATAGPMVADDPFDTTIVDWSWYTAQAGWNMPGFDAASHGWAAPSKATNAPPSTAIVEPLLAPAAVTTQTLRPVSITRLPNGDHVLDMGTNFVGVISLTGGVDIRGSGGGNVTLHHGERLNSDGSVNTTFAGHDPTAFQRDVHLFSSATDVPASVQPTFTWHGFQYAQVVCTGGVSCQFSGRDAAFLVIHPDVQLTGRLAFGDDASSGGDGELFNALHSMVLTSQLSNIAGYMPTDCPTREKHGWLGDAQNTAQEALMNINMAPIYQVFLDNIVDSQTSTGDVLPVVPTTANPFLDHDTAATKEASQVDALRHSLDIRGAGSPGGGAADISWTAAFPYISSLVAAHYGDSWSTLAQDRYDALTMFMDFLVSRADSNKVTPHLATDWTWGDWCAVQSRAVCTPNTGPPLAGGNYIEALDAMVTLATLKGDSSSAARYAAAAATARPELHKAYFNKSMTLYGSFEVEAQTLTAVPLAVGGVVPDALQSAVVQALHDNVHTAYGDHLTVGSGGQQHILEVLTQQGLYDTALAMATQRDFPSWGWWHVHGHATSCWENWSGMADPSHPPPPTHNHIFLCGGLGKWLHSYVAGIAPAAGARGTAYAHVAVSPHVSATAGPASSNATQDTVRGQVAVAWSRTQSTNSTLWLSVSIPAGTTATVSVPLVGLDASSCTVSIAAGGIVWSAGAFRPGAVGVTAARQDTLQGAIAFEVLSGAYVFRTHGPGLLPL